MTSDRRVKRAGHPAATRATRRAPSGCGRRSGKISSGARRRPKAGPGSPARLTISPDLSRTTPRIRPIILRIRGRGGRGMDRIRIVGGRPLNGTHPDFRRQERHPAADDREPAHRSDADPRQRAAAGRRRAAAAHPVQPRRRHDGARQAAGRVAGARPHHAYRRLAHRRHHRALRSRLARCGRASG